MHPVSAGFLTFVGAIAAAVGICQGTAPLQAESKAAPVDFKPQPLTPVEVATASRVIAIGVDLTSFLREEQVPTELWSDVPPASVDYAASRAALLRHIRVLLDELQAKR